MEKSFPRFKESNPNALKYAAAQMMSTNRNTMNNVYKDKSEWEAGDVNQNYDGTYSMANLSTRRSTHATNNPKSAVMDTLDQFQSDYYNKTGRNNEMI